MITTRIPRQIYDHQPNQHFFLVGNYSHSNSLHWPVNLFIGLGTRIRVQAARTTIMSCREPWSKPLPASQPTLPLFGPPSSPATREPWPCSFLGRPTRHLAKNLSPTTFQDRPAHLPTQKPLHPLLSAQQQSCRAKNEPNSWPNQPIPISFTIKPKNGPTTHWNTPLHLKNSMKLIILWRNGETTTFILNLYTNSHSPSFL